MKLGVIGGREFSDYSLLKTELDKFKNIDVIVSGGARGADLLSERYANENGIEKEIYLPNYTAFSKKAPLLRNTQIVQASDMIIAFWDGKSTGTKDSLNKAKRLNKPCRIVYYNIENNLGILCKQ